MSARGDTPLEAGSRLFCVGSQFLELTKRGSPENLYTVSFKLLPYDSPFSMEDAVYLPVFLTNNPGYVFATSCWFDLTLVVVACNLRVVLVEQRFSNTVRPI